LSGPARYPNFMVVTKFGLPKRQVGLCLRLAARCSGMVLLVPAFFAPAATQARATAQPPFMLEALLGSDFLFWLNMKFARAARCTRMSATHAGPPA